MLKVSLPGWCPKNVWTPSPTVAHYGPIPTAMICRSSFWLRSVYLFIFLSLSLSLSLSLCVSLSHTNRDCFFPSIHVVSSIQSIAYFIHHLSLEWSTFTHLKLNTDWHGRLSAFTEFQHFHSACTSAELIWLCLWKQLRSMRILLRLTPRITHNYSAE